MRRSVIDRGVVLKSIIIGRVCLILPKKMGPQLGKQFLMKKGNYLSYEPLTSVIFSLTPSAHSLV